MDCFGDARHDKVKRSRGASASAKAPFSPTHAGRKRRTAARSLAPRAAERLERQRHAVGRHYARGIERPRDGRVIAADADEIDHALLAEQSERAVEGRIVDIAPAVELNAEIVDRRLVV